MNTQTLSTPSTPKNRDELALGTIGPNGKRRGGYIQMYKAMRKWREKLIDGDVTEAELETMAYDQADKQLAKRAASDLSDQIHKGAEYVRKLRLEAPAAFVEAKSRTELLALAQHHTALDRTILIALIANWERLSD